MQIVIRPHFQKQFLRDAWLLILPFLESKKVATFKIYWMPWVGSRSCPPERCMHPDYDTLKHTIRIQIVVICFGIFMWRKTDQLILVKQIHLKVDNGPSRTHGFLCIKPSVTPWMSGMLYDAHAFVPFRGLHTEGKEFLWVSPWGITRRQLSLASG